MKTYLSSLGAFTVPFDAATKFQEAELRLSPDKLLQGIMNQILLCFESGKPETWADECVVRTMLVRFIQYTFFGFF